MALGVLPRPRSHSAGTLTFCFRVEFRFRIGFRIGFRLRFRLGFRIGFRLGFRIGFRLGFRGATTPVLSSAAKQERRFFLNFF